VHAQGIEPEFTDAAVALAEEGFDPEFGARPLRRAIQRLVENELSRMVLGGDLKPGRPGRRRCGGATHPDAAGGEERAAEAM
jgi:ATP-dependent Clp protease ATP-binding subunit ClpC